MDFEYDQHKSYANKEKHGVDFKEIQAIWNDPDLLLIPARTDDEPRYLVIGKIKEKHWSVVITFRSMVVRIISARRSRKNEVMAYESQGI